MTNVYVIFELITISRHNIYLEYQIINYIKYLPIKTNFLSETSSIRENSYFYPKNWCTYIKVVAVMIFLAEI